MRLENFVDQSVGVIPSRGRDQPLHPTSLPASHSPKLQSVVRAFATVVVLPVSTSEESGRRIESSDGDEGDHDHHDDDGGGVHMCMSHTWSADTGVRIDTPFIWHKGERGLCFE